MNQKVIEEFRATGGRVGGEFEGRRLMLLTSTEAGSGTRRTTPLISAPDGEGIIVVASNGDGAADPAWYHDILANPRVAVESGQMTFEAEAAVLDGEERDRVFARIAEADPTWSDQEARAARPLPVISLRPVGGGPPPGRLGDALVKVHDYFRQELALLRREIENAGDRGPGLALQLRMNCLSMCHGLHGHHSIEDGSLFPMIDAEHPELAAIVGRLRREHAVVKELLDGIQALVTPGTSGDLQPGEPGEPAEPKVVLAELDRLVTDLEAHLAYEEAELVPVLNALPAPG